MQTLNIFFSNKNSHKYFNLVFLVGFFFLLNNFGFNETRSFFQDADTFDPKTGQDKDE